MTPDDARSVAPALEKYTRVRLLGEVRKRPGLAPRDRGLVTVAALIARQQTIETRAPADGRDTIGALIAAGQVAPIAYHLDRATDNGLTQPQAAEIITHLAFYVGWPNAFSALPVASEVFAQRSRRGAIHEDNHAGLRRTAMKTRTKADASAARRCRGGQDGVSAGARPLRRGRAVPPGGTARSARVHP